MLQSRLKAAIVSDVDDILVSQRDGEVIHGLGGYDQINANHFKLKIFGDAGNDLITSGYDKTAAYGGDGNDTIYGATYGSQIIDGGKGADVIDLTLYTAPIASTTTLSFAGALSGVRVYLSGDGTGYGTKGDAGGDVYLGNFGRVLGSAGDDWITDTTPNSLEVGIGQKFGGAAGNDRLILGMGNDTGIGGLGNDSIDGGFGNDRVLGGDGNDTLTAGRGHDVVRGGLGADHFVFTPGEMFDAFFESKFAGTPTTDRILDFNAVEGDIIDLSAIEARGKLPFTFLSTGEFTGQAGELRYEVSTKGVTLIAYDGSLRGNLANGQFDPVYMTVFLQGVTSLTEADFIL